MKLKRYQQEVLDALRTYVSKVRDAHIGPEVGFIQLTQQPYKKVDDLEDVPFVCIKVPTGGGKTFIASNAIGILMKGLLPQRNDFGLVVWLSPLETITEQTLAKLRNRNDPNRIALDERFENRVAIFDVKEARAITPDALHNNICIIVATMASFRREDTEGLKVFQDAGSLIGHFEGIHADEHEYLDVDKESKELKYSLSNVIRLHNPIVIVDEGHNAQTDLSFDMLKFMNPSFVMEMTATPRSASNVLVSIPAQSLKEEKMIKMPLYLASVTQWQDTIMDARDKLIELQKIADKHKKDYIRPIMLIQAEQEKESPTKIHVEKIVEFLVGDMKIKREEIAVRTGKQNELPSAEELISPSCPIKYIITVNALKEGWDCPFPYVLASVSNMGARVSVEQTIGRIMRLPYAREHKAQELNSGYIFATSNNFADTTKAVIEALRSNGYEDAEEVIGDGVDVPNKTTKIAIKDEDIKIPMVAVVEGRDVHPLEYVGDLIDDAFTLNKASDEITLPTKEASEIEKIDLSKEGELTQAVAGKLAFVYQYEGQTEVELLLWLSRKVKRDFVSASDMGKYLDRVLKKLLKTTKLSLLASERYRVVERIDEAIESYTAAVAHKRFYEFMKAGKINVEKITFDLPKELTLPGFAKEHFRKHAYGDASSMNSEELALARRIDALESVSWWLRNPERSGFFIQGWGQYKFFPDFVVKTHKGKYFVIEYKGEHLMGSEDTTYKDETGKAWERAAGSNYHFRLVDKRHVPDVIAEIDSAPMLIK